MDMMTMARKAEKFGLMAKKEFSFFGGLIKNFNFLWLIRNHDLFLVNREFAKHTV
jgi:hypothetical protein